MAVGAVVLLALTAIFDEAYALPSSASTWAAQTSLVVAGSVGVFWLYVFVLRGWTASAASYQLVLIPLVRLPSRRGSRMSTRHALCGRLFVVLIGSHRRASASWGRLTLLCRAAPIVVWTARYPTRPGGAGAVERGGLENR